MLWQFKTALGADLPAAIDEIVQMARIPNPRRQSQLRDLILGLIEQRWHYRSPEFIAECDERRRRWIVRLGRVFSARVSFRKAAMDLRHAIADYDKYYGKRDRRDESAPAPIARLLNEVLQWAGKDPPYYARNNRRGRPPGTAHFELYMFVSYLLEITENVGGRLTFDKNYPDKGSLPRALHLLRPYLPAGFIPADLPVRTLIQACLDRKKERETGTKNMGSRTGKSA
jgi:hypothetical protein